jgi:hypothetical protein
MVVMEDGPIKIQGKYHWNKSEAIEIKKNLENKLMEDMENTTNPIKQATYEIQLRSLEIEEVVFH